MLNVFHVLIFLEISKVFGTVDHKESKIYINFRLREF